MPSLPADPRLCCQWPPFASPQQSCTRVRMCKRTFCRAGRQRKTHGGGDSPGLWQLTRERRLAVPVLAGSRRNGALVLCSITFSPIPTFPASMPGTGGLETVQNKIKRSLPLDLSFDHCWGLCPSFPSSPLCIGSCYICYLSSPGDSWNYEITVQIQLEVMVIIKKERRSCPSVFYLWLKAASQIPAWCSDMLEEAANPQFFTL